MEMITALQLSGYQYSRSAGLGYELVCPWCHHGAWATRDFMQCTSAACPTQAASPMDILARTSGGYERAVDIFARMTRTDSAVGLAEKEMIRRHVMDVWISICLSRPTGAAIRRASRLQAAGRGIQASRLNAVVLDSNQIAMLLRTAAETGGMYPASWEDAPPDVVTAYCLQSTPHTIDRLILEDGSRTASIDWHHNTAGISCLLGMSPTRPRLLVSDIRFAMVLQHAMAVHGAPEEVAGSYVDYRRQGPAARWEMPQPFLLAAVRSPMPRTGALLHSPDDIPHMQDLLDRFPDLAGQIGCMSVRASLLGKPRAGSVPWELARYGHIASLIPPGARTMPADAASLFERTGARQEDTARLLATLRKEGRTALAEDVGHMANNRTIARDGNNIIRETADGYQLVSPGGSSPVSNFSLEVLGNVMFDTRETAYCQASMRCGRTTMPVLIPHSALQGNLAALQGELQRQMAAAGHGGDMGRLPTVVLPNHFRNHVMAHIKRQISTAPLTHGIDSLGWKPDRKAFAFPGFVVDMDGERQTCQVFCPDVPVLRKFTMVGGWARTYPTGLDRSCQDVIAMLAATAVRYFRRAPTLACCIMQSASSVRVMEAVASALGQTSVFELNSNPRGGSKVDGIHGYPIMAVGARAVIPEPGQAPFVHMTDSGYTMPTEPSPDDLEAARAAVQCALLRVVEWCLQTNADEFVQARSLVHHRSLLREGYWLLSELCAVEHAEDASPTALEDLLGRIPYGDTIKRITLIDGEDLVIDVSGLPHDRDSILREVRAMGSRAAIEDEKIMSPAVKLLPALSVFYGQDPEVAVIMDRHGKR